MRAPLSVKRVFVYRSDGGARRTVELAPTRVTLVYGFLRVSVFPLCLCGENVSSKTYHRDTELFTETQSEGE